MEEDGIIRGEPARKVDESSIIDPDELARIEKEKKEKAEREEAERIAAKEERLAAEAEQQRLFEEE